MLCKVLILPDGLSAWTSVNLVRTTETLQHVVGEVEDVEALVTVVEEDLAAVAVAEVALEIEADEGVVEVEHAVDAVAQPTVEASVTSPARRRRSELAESIPEPSQHPSLTFLRMKSTALQRTISPL
jgi:hypothetical protein